MSEAIEYPCGCSASGPSALPEYCPQHGVCPHGVIASGPMTGVCYPCIINALQAENARLMSEVARLREALGNAFCPRPVHGRPAFDTVKGCQQSDNCGCDLGEAFAKP